MGRRGPRHLDNRRTLLPLSYFASAADFGRASDPALVLPEGGDIVSQRIAVIQHRLVLEWASNLHRPSAAQLCRTWGFSKQLLSRCTLGERWFGETLLAVFIDATSEPASPLVVARPGVTVGTGPAGPGRATRDDGAARRGNRGRAAPGGARHRYQI